MKPIVVYSPGYDFSMFGIEKLHPFDGRKFSRAFSLIERERGSALTQAWVAPQEPVSDEDLCRVHSRAYLDSLRSPSVVAKALEMWPLRLIPHRLLDRNLLTPMRLAVSGTLLALQHALESGSNAMNLGGGFHHAFSDHGEGFCIYADVAIAIAAARTRRLLTAEDPILIIDLDAHRGNGVWALCGSDPSIHILDLYNFQIYPGLFPEAVEDFPFQVPLRAQTADAAYLDTLREQLPKFLRAAPNPRVAIYNAGTDVVRGDPLGRLDVSFEAVAARDQLVLDALAAQRVPTVIVTSGGYTEQSHRLIAQLALRVV